MARRRDAGALGALSQRGDQYGRQDTCSFLHQPPDATRSARQNKKAEKGQGRYTATGVPNRNACHAKGRVASFAATASPAALPTRARHAWIRHGFEPGWGDSEEYDGGGKPARFTALQFCSFTVLQF